MPLPRTGCRAQLPISTHARAHPSTLGLAGLLVMVAKSPSLKTKILPHRSFPRVNAVDSVYMPKERACPSKGKAFTWDAQRIDPERKACPQSLRPALHIIVSQTPMPPGGKHFYLHFIDEETGVSERWRDLDAVLFGSRAWTPAPLSPRFLLIFPWRPHPILRWLPCIHLHVPG